MFFYICQSSPVPPILHPPSPHPHSPPPPPPHRYPHPHHHDHHIIDEGEDVVFTELTELVREANEDKWESKVDKYVNDGLTEEEARLKAN
jgi:hypothetical protein